MDTAGSRIKNIRKKHKLSQKEFASSLHISDTLISKIEHDKIPVTERLLQQIASVYNVNIDWLLGNSSNMNQSEQEIVFDYSSVNIQKNLLESQFTRLLSLSESLDSGSQEAYLNLLKELLTLIEETLIMMDNIRVSPNGSKDMKNITDFFYEKYRESLEKYVSKIKD